MRKVQTSMGHLAFAAFAALGAHAAAPVDSGAIYSPVGKRDPFKPPAVTAVSREVTAVSPLERFPVEQLQLRAIMRGIGRPRAMFQDPEGKTFIVSEGDRIGRERAAISRVLNSEVIVTERTFNYLGQETLYEKILSLPEEKTDGALTTGPERGGR